jgi:hypothetical protein
MPTFGLGIFPTAPPKDINLQVFSRVAGRLTLLLLACLCLPACSGPSALQQALGALPERVELTGVPAFPENAYQGVPSALSSLLVQQGVDTSPGQVAKQLHLPEQQEQVQENMLKQINANGLLVYSLQPKLADVLKQVAAGYPVLVRFDQGFGLIKMPRYAVLIGYDREEQTLLLRSGSDRRWSTGFSSFDSAWQEAGAWAILLLAPVQLPAEVDAQRWLQAAETLERSGHAAAAGNARQALQRHSRGGA